jgi:hypothetical protein
MQLFAVLALIKPGDDVVPQAAIAVSYCVWAYGMGEVICPTMWNDNGYIAFGALRLALGRWLKDTSLFRDSWEIVIERSGRYWS